MQQIDLAVEKGWLNPLMKPFEPASGLRNPHLQTLLPRLIHRTPSFEPHWQRLTTPDDDFLDLAWTDNLDQSPEDQPVFILFHGLEGSFNSPYAHGVLSAVRKKGWLGVIMHFRGCGREMNRRPRSYHSGETGDARFFIDWLREAYPYRTLYAAGISLGGNMLVNYLAEEGGACKLAAAQVVCPPLNLADSSLRIQQGFSSVYHHYLLSSMKKNLVRKIELLDGEMPYNKEQVAGIKTIWQFDNEITAPLHGYKDAEDYYQRCSGLGKLSGVRTPLRIIHAKDDPFMTAAVIPSKPLPNHIEYELCQHGGHVGFIAGTCSRPRFWLEDTLPCWFERMRSEVV